MLNAVSEGPCAPLATIAGAKAKGMANAGQAKGGKRQHPNRETSALFGLACSGASTYTVQQFGRPKAQRNIHQHYTHLPVPHSDPLLLLLLLLTMSNQPAGVRIC